MVENRLYKIEGMETKEIDNYFASNLDELYTFPGSASIYHHRGSTIIVPLGEKVEGDFRKDTFRVMTEMANIKTLISHLEKITKKELEEIW